MTAPNVWTQMNYIPPRGQCNYKQSVLSPKCPCLRFMLHPLKSASSYECDGCTHHASFHTMENKTEDEVRKRWEQEAKDKAGQEDEAQKRPKKRIRAIEYSEQVIGEHLLGEYGTAARGRGAVAKKSGRAAAAKSRKKVTEIVEDEDDDVIEVD